MEIKAKDASLFSQIFAGLWIIGWSAFTFITGKGIKVGDIILTVLKDGKTVFLFLLILFS